MKTLFSKKAKRITAGLCVACVIMIAFPLGNVYAARTTATAAFSNIGMTINGEEFNMRPVIIDGVSYFPVRTIGYALNCKTEWISEPKQIILTSAGEKVGYDSFEQGDGLATAIFDDSITLTADGKNVQTPIAIINDRSYVPIKVVAEAMGKRATWDADTRTIQIVNPQTVKVDESIKDYYVYDLPEVKSQEDYLVGNWVGYVNRTNDGRAKAEWFISKNSNNTYKVIYKKTLESNKSYIVQLTAVYDSETKVLTTKFDKWIDRGYLSSDVYYYPDELLLDGDVLDWISDGTSEFKDGRLTRF